MTTLDADLALDADRVPAPRTEEPAATDIDVLAVIAQTCRATGRGDLEARVPFLGEEPQLVEVRNAVNRLLDLVDAYVRESAASLEAANDHRFYRRFLTTGMPGAFGDGARTINGATSAMAQTTAQLDASAQERLAFADTFEQVVMGLSDQVAAAATEMEASARSMVETAAVSARGAATAADNATTANEAVTVAAAAVEQLDSTTGSIEAQAAHSNEMGQAATAEAEKAHETVAGLAAASDTISNVVRVISQVAAQTRLLALNATIEAARAGDLGKGFAVVANEVKGLAAQTAEATNQIEQQIGQIQAVSSDAVNAIESIAGVVTGMGQNLGAIASAVAEQRGATRELSRTTVQAAEASSALTDEVSAIGEGAESTRAAAEDMTRAALELSRLATDLRSHVGSFLEQIR